MRILNQMGILESARPAEGKAVNADGSVESAASVVVCEHFMDLVVNERLAAKLVCTPSNLVELALGRLVTEGIISGAEDVESIYICEKGNTAKVFLNASQREISLQPSVEREPTCCTGNKALLKNAYGDSLRRLQRAEWKKEWIFALANAFAEDSGLHKATKGTHSCYLGGGGEIVFSCEDIGRHNAMDKCIGYAVSKGLDRGKCILFTTGRVPTDMVKKAVAAGVPVLASKAVPTDAAIQMAAEYNLTLICKAWPDRFVVFHEAV